MVFAPGRKFVDAVYKKLEKLSAMPTPGRPTTKSSIYIFKRTEKMFYSFR